MSIRTVTNKITITATMYLSCHEPERREALADNVAAFKKALEKARAEHLPNVRHAIHVLEEKESVHE